MFVRSVRHRAEYRQILSKFAELNLQTRATRNPIHRLRQQQAWIGGKAIFKTEIKDRKYKRGGDCNFHSSKGGSCGSNTNARTELRGGNVIFLTLQGANNSENKMVVHLGSELRSLLPEPYNNRDNGMVVNIGDKAVDKICDIFSIGQRGNPVSERRAAYIKILVEVGCHVVTGVTILGKTQDSIQEKIIVFLPDGTPMTEADVAKLKTTNTSGCIISLCKENLCFAIPEEGKKTCSEHTVEVRLLSQHLSHFSFQHVLMFFMFIYIHRNVLSAAVQKFFVEACVNLVVRKLTTYNTMVKFVIILAALQSAVETEASIAQRNARVR